VIVYSLATDAHWQAMCEAFGRPDLVTDPRFVDVQARLRNGDATNEAVESATRRHTTAEVVELLAQAGVPVAPVQDRAAMIADPQVRHRELLVEQVHPSAGRVRMVRPPARFSKTPTSVHRPAPRFGEHSDEVLAGLAGYDAERIAALRAEGVVR
jgi:crotonobetainyl-CoA:carnitine CoA-transferase CaiB-like acyl-CoA transferase